MSGLFATVLLAVCSAVLEALLDAAKKRKSDRAVKALAKLREGERLKTQLPRSKLVLKRRPMRSVSPVFCNPVGKALLLCGLSACGTMHHPSQPTPCVLREIRVSPEVRSHLQDQLEVSDQNPIGMKDFVVDVATHNTFVREICANTRSSL